ncbi:hypothetical protein EVAR_67789_1 [Eumeta japonica]|uniref:Uncharacterized protein n=1 Tax=Eumeta variegata TaxID=151549 RepID=A0A4C1ZT31_EUMVA|nr:hypothetical protein EVAR_67789_1 [Eumeta japonica]
MFNNKFLYPFLGHAVVDLATIQKWADSTDDIHDIQMISRISTAEYSMRVYASNMSKSFEKRDEFWADVREIFVKCDRNKRIVILGDFIGWVDVQCDGYEKVLDRYQFFLKDTCACVVGRGHSGRLNYGRATHDKSDNGTTSFYPLQGARVSCRSPARRPPAVAARAGGVSIARSFLGTKLQNRRDHNHVGTTRRYRHVLFSCPRGRIAHSSWRETDVERGGRLCLFVARPTLSLALQSANARPSEGTSSDSESDPGSSDSPDHSGFTTVRRRRAAKGSKPKASGLTQTSDGSMCYRLTPAPRKPKKANVAKATPSGKSTSSIYASPVSWRTPSQPATAPQGAVDDGGVKAAAPAAAKNNRGDEADVTAPPTPAPRGPKPPPMFVQDKDRWTELRRRCADKGIQFSQARNSVQGLKLQAKTVADFKNLQNLSVLLSGVKAEQPRKRALPGQCHNCQSYGHRPLLLSFCALREMPVTMAQRNVAIRTQTVLPPVSCKQKAIRPTTLMPACSKETLHPRRPWRRTAQSRRHLSS